MTTNEDFRRYDQIQSSRIMAEFKGQVHEVVCPTCKGKGTLHGSACYDCAGKGSYKLEY